MGGMGGEIGRPGVGDALVARERPGAVPADALYDAGHMKPDEEKVLSEALQLPADARATIAGRLLKSLDDEDIEEPAEVEAAWVEEIARRKRELSTGVVKAMSADEALKFIASDDPADDDR